MIFPSNCMKTGRPTQPAICIHCNRKCPFAGKDAQFQEGEKKTDGRDDGRYPG